jgi:fructose-1,6-bisphosphatase I
MDAAYSRQSITQFMENSWTDNASLVGLDQVVKAIADGTRLVHEQVQSAALTDVLGETGDVNVQGEFVQKLDAFGSDIFVDLLGKSGRVAAVVSEEIEDPVVPGYGENQTFIVHTDPVDGSSNIDVAISIGSIFGIWARTTDDEVSHDILLRPGREQVAAVYSIYGSSTVLIIATRGSVNGFTLDTQQSDFFLTHPNIRMPNKCEYYSINEGNFKKLDDPMQAVVTNLREKYSLRYVGSLVADFHRNLLKGGIFLYPGDNKNPNGKLRLMYEANPLGFIAEQAGGAAFSADLPILDIQPLDPHQRTPLIIGNTDEVMTVVDTIKSS